MMNNVRDKNASSVNGEDGVIIFNTTIRREAIVPRVPREMAKAYDNIARIEHSEETS